MGIIADFLGFVHHDISRYNQKKYNQWRKKKAYEKRRNNSKYYSRTYPRKPYTQPNTQSSSRSSFANPTPRFPTLKGGELVRSLSEKYVADFLFTHKVSYEYEKHIFLEGKEIKPDFYLPTYDIYLEFWGMLERPDYFETFKWKVGMYNKHHINFIALNSDDLPDLDKRFGQKLQIAIRTRK